MVQTLRQRWISVFFGIVLLLGVVALQGEESPLVTGERLYLENKPAEAKDYLETALKLNPRNERVYLYLGTVYEQLGDYNHAVEILRRGIEHARNLLDRMYFNIGNNFFKQDRNSLAAEMYTKAIEVNPSLSEAYLNRANSLLRTDSYEQAVTDYRRYLSLEPSSPQRQNIERVVDLLTEMLETERHRRAEEEQQRAADAARQRALLAEVLNSLERASEQTRSLSAETEGIQEVEEETDIID